MNELMSLWIHDEGITNDDGNDIIIGMIPYRNMNNQFTFELTSYKWTD